MAILLYKKTISATFKAAQIYRGGDYETFSRMPRGGYHKVTQPSNRADHRRKPERCELSRGRNPGRYMIIKRA